MHGINFRYIISFILLSAIIAIGTFFSYQNFTAKQYDAKTIKLASRQITLGQTISQIAAELNSKQNITSLQKQILLEELSLILDVWEESHYALKNGSSKYGIEPTYSSEISTAYDGAEVTLQYILESARPLVLAHQQSDTNSIELYTNQILSIDTVFISSMKAIVDMHVEQAEMRLDRVSKMVYLTAAILLIGILSSWFILIRPALKHAAEIDKSKSEFVALAAHHLRSPLSAVNWYSELLMETEKKLDDEQKDYVNEIASGSHKMAALVDALLHVSSIDLGEFVVNPTDVDIKRLIRDVADDFKPKIDEKKLKLILNIAKDISTQKLDKTLTRMIFENLLSNSIKFTEQGGVITVTANKSLGGIYIEFHDTGIGIPNAQQGYIFKKLFRADNAKKGQVEGAGLGLYITKAIVEGTGGTIGFSSTKNKGTTFYIKLPSTGMQKMEGKKGLLDEHNH